MNTLCRSGRCGRLAPAPALCFLRLPSGSECAEWFVVFLPKTEPPAHCTPLTSPWHCVVSLHRLHSLRRAYFTNASLPATSPLHFSPLHLRSTLLFATECVSSGVRPSLSVGLMRFPSHSTNTLQLCIWSIYGAQPVDKGDGRSARAGKAAGARHASAQRDKSRDDSRESLVSVSHASLFDLRCRALLSSLSLAAFLSSPLFFPFSAAPDGSSVPPLIDLVGED